MALFVYSFLALYYVKKKQMKMTSCIYFIHYAQFCMHILRNVFVGQKTLQGTNPNSCMSIIITNNTFARKIVHSHFQIDRYGRCTHRTFVAIRTMSIAIKLTTVCSKENLSLNTPVFCGRKCQNVDPQVILHHFRFICAIEHAMSTL